MRTEAGNLPRSLTVKPFCRAQVRISALVGDCEPACGRAAEGFTRVDVARALFLAEPEFRFAVGLGRVRTLSLLGASVSPGELETTSVTPYRAPRARMASSRGSLESTVSFTTAPFDVRNAGTPARRHRIGNLEQPSSDKQMITHLVSS